MVICDDNQPLSRQIIFAGIAYQSLKAIANIMNTFFMDKIKNILSKFGEPDLDTIKILQFLIPEPVSNSSYRNNDI